MKAFTVNGLLAAAALAWVTAAAAHTAWLEPVSGTEGEYLLLFGGHEGKLETYPPEKLKSVDAFDAGGRKLDAARTARSDGVHVTVRGAPVILAVHFDNGTWSRGTDGKSVEEPMNENPGAKEGTRAVKYGKTIVAWAPVVTKPLGQPFEIVPVNVQAPRAGRPWPVRVLIGGKPAADVEISRGEQGVDSVRTNAEGIAHVVPRPGLNRLWAGKRTPVANEPGYTQISVEYLLVFTAR